MFFVFIEFNKQPKIAKPGEISQTSVAPLRMGFLFSEKKIIEENWFRTDFRGQAFWTPNISIKYTILHYHSTSHILLYLGQFYLY